MPSTFPSLTVYSIRILPATAGCLRRHLLAFPVTTRLGVIGGAVLGNQIEGNGQPRYQNVQRCTTETYYEDRTVGYDVVYEYAGRQYNTRTQADPGPWIALSVQPLAGNNQGRIYSTQPDPSEQQGVYSQSGVVTSTYRTHPTQPTYAVQPAYPDQPCLLYTSPSPRD